MKRGVILINLLFIFSFSIVAQTTDVIIDEEILEPKDPIVATVVAMGPGFFAHGFGNFYAENYERGLMLFGIEVISLVTIGTGYAIYSNPNNFTSIGGNYDEVRRGGLITLLTGLAFFAGSWLADITTAGQAALQYNIEHNIKFKINQQSYIPSLHYTLKF